MAEPNISEREHIYIELCAELIVDLALAGEHATSARLLTQLFNDYTEQKL